MARTNEAGHLRYGERAVSTSLDRKLEAAARRAEADRKARGGFTPAAPPAPTPAPSPAPVAPQKRFYNDVGTQSPKVKRVWCPAPNGGGWYDFFGDNSVIYTTSNGEPPADDMSNVTGSKKI